MCIRDSPTDYNKFHGKNDARFSFFECFENKEVFNALISAVETWAKSKNCTEMIGPMAFSDKEPQGFLTVSYTHLDVYKRQIYRFFINILDL